MSVESDTNPNVASVRPVVTTIFVPKRSTSLELNGDPTMSTTAHGKKRMPVANGE